MITFHLKRDWPHFSLPRFCCSSIYVITVVEFSKNTYNWVTKHKFLKNQDLCLKEILHKAPIDILCIDETKLDETFPDAQFMIENYQFPLFKRYRNKKGGGKMVFIRKELLAKRLEEFETKSTETICIEL